MKRLLRWTIILGVLIAIGSAIAGPTAAYFREKNRIQYREVEVTCGSVVAVVNSTGTVKPVQSVSVGTFVSGPIASIAVDFNSEIKKGELLAKIDPRLYEAAVAQARAFLANQKAGVERAKAQLQQARNDEARSVALRAENRTFISDTEMDQFKYKRMTLEAELLLAETAVDQAQAALDTAEANLGYTRIVAPVDGVIIERKVDPGQTVAASFQTPELFTVAPDMRKEMRVFASVDEADIGLIRVGAANRPAGALYRGCLSRRLVHRHGFPDPSERNDQSERRHLSGCRFGAESGFEAGSTDDGEPVIPGRRGQ